jgi:nuclear transport factor 2 (NTF2) superfamily protein
MPALIPPFTRETAIAKVRLAEDAWNSRDPHRVSLAYTEDSRWRNRAEFITGRAEIVAFLTRKWQKPPAKGEPDSQTLPFARNTYFLRYCFYGTTTTRINFV